MKQDKKYRKKEESRSLTSMGDENQYHHCYTLKSHTIFIFLARTAFKIKVGKHFSEKVDSAKV